MIFFKEPSTFPAAGSVYAYETEEQWLQCGSPDLVHMTPDELDEYTRPTVILTADKICAQIDAAADTARAAVVGDPTRTIEYERAAAEAAQFKAAGYPAESVPRTVAAWAINGRTAQQAADDILAEAAAYTEALYQIRETRLQAKELVRQAMNAGKTQQAQDIAAETIAAIQAAVAGVGNAQV
tara:strand:- start:69 stop:617 length:549 start_codon:yes stop_codon:yes gene_type:complete